MGNFVKILVEEKQGPSQFDMGLSTVRITSEQSGEMRVAISHPMESQKFHVHPDDHMTVMLALLQRATMEADSRNGTEKLVDPSNGSQIWISHIGMIDV